MGQYWYMVNLDRRCISGCWYGLYENFLRRGDDLLGWLLPPPFNPNFAVEEWVKERALRSQAETCSPLLRLPTEVIGHIFDELSTFHQLALATTCTSMFIIGVNRIAHDLRIDPECRSFAGERLILIGDGAQADDMPVGMLTEVEAAEFDKPLPPRPADADENDYYEKPTHDPYDVWRRNFSPMADPVFADGVISLCYQLQTQLLRRGPPRVQRAQEIACTMLRSMFVKNYDHINAYRYVDGRILRNISKHVFVREAAIQELHARAPAARTVDMGYEQYWPYGLSLGDVIFMRICWSSDSNAKMSSEDTITRGVWAGDRFDLAILEDGADMEGWKDVTDEVVEEMEWFLKKERKWWHADE